MRCCLALLCVIVAAMAGLAHVGTALADDASQTSSNEATSP